MLGSNKSRWSCGFPLSELWSGFSGKEKCYSMRNLRHKNVKFFRLHFLELGVGHASSSLLWPWASTRLPRAGESYMQEAQV